MRGDFDALDHAVEISRPASKPFEPVSQITYRSVHAVIGEQQPCAHHGRVLGKAGGPRGEVQSAIFPQEDVATIRTQPRNIRDPSAAVEMKTIEKFRSLRFLR